MPRFTRAVPRLPVADLDASIAFYTGVLGFVCAASWSEEGSDGTPTFAILQRDDVELQLFVAGEGAEIPGQATVSFDVDDARALHAAIRDRLAVEWGPEVYAYGRRELAVRDPDGFLLIFSEPTDDPVA